MTDEGNPVIQHPAGPLPEGVGYKPVGGVTRALAFTGAKRGAHHCYTLPGGVRLYLSDAPDSDIAFDDQSDDLLDIRVDRKAAKGIAAVIRDDILPCEASRLAQPRRFGVFPRPPAVTEHDLGAGLCLRAELGWWYLRGKDQIALSAEALEALPPLLDLLTGPEHPAPTATPATKVAEPAEGSAQRQGPPRPLLEPYRVKPRETQKKPL